MPKSVRIAPAILCFVLCAPGCGPSQPIVKGKVTYKNSPLTSGEIRFFGQNNVRSALIGTDGSYVVKDCPVGDVKVAVLAARQDGGQNLGPILGKKEATKGGLAESRSLIPERYNDPATSGLGYTIKAGEQKIDIDLKD